MIFLQEINSSYENNRYESDDDEEEDEDDIENNFYTAESLEEDENFIEAIAEYKKILAQETSEKTEWGLKSLIKLLKISINQVQGGLKKVDFCDFRGIILHFWHITTTS